MLLPVAARCSFQSGHSKEGIRWGTSQNRIDIQQVVIQSRAASMTTLDKLDPSLTGRIRISTMICYASARVWAERLGKPVRRWMSDQQDAFVRGIAAEFPGVPHR